MTLRVAITRALPEAEATAARLRDMGFEPVLAPLLRIEFRRFDADIAGVQALLFTSANGVRAFAAARETRNLPALCVGDATAAAAREAGFDDVRSADGDVHALAAMAKAVLDPKVGKLLHISGAHVAGDLAGMLRDAGFEAERRVGYEAVAATELPGGFDQPLDVVLFHSARAAEAFVRLDTAHKSETLTAACISAAVAQAANHTRWKNVVVAEAPREDALLAALSV